jgi:peptidoglycan endopeptidase LytE
MTALSRYLTHAAVLVSALTVAGYAASGATGNALRLGVINAEGQAMVQGGEVDDISLGRTSTILKPIELPAGPPVSRVPASYTVAPGDTVQSIADHFGITADDLRWSNGALASTDTLSNGEQLTIPPVHGFVYTTQDTGESVAQLAARFQVDVQTIQDFNYMGDANATLPGGIQLVIPGGIGPNLYPRRATTQPPHLGPYANGKFAYGYCTWYVASRVPVPWTGNAWEWYGNAKAMGYSVGSTPAPGAIMVTWESWVGHVAYVEAVNGDGSWTVSEMNYKGWGIIDTRTIKPGGVPLIGFIYMDPKQAA